MLRFILSNGPLQTLATRWIHPSVSPGERCYEDQRAALSLALLLVVATAPLLPLLLTAAPANTALHAAMAALAASPLFFIATLSLFGHLNAARLAALGILAAGWLVACTLTGGLASGLLPFLAVFFVEPKLWSIPRPLLIGLAIAGISFVWLAIVKVMGAANLPAIGVDPLALTVAAALYAAGVAVRLPRSKEPGPSSAVDLPSRLLNATRCGVLTLHGPDGRARTIIGDSRAVTGRCEGELLDGGFVDSLHLQDRLTFKHAVSTALHTGETKICRVRVKRQAETAGAWIPLTIHLSRLDMPGEAQGVAGFLTIDEDEDAPRREVTGQASYKHFLAVVSHELRTPLNAIIGFSDILKEELFGQFEFDRQREYAEHINASGHHLLNIVNDLLDVSRIEAGKYELSLAAFLPSSMAFAVVDMLSPVASAANVTLIHDVPKDLPEMFADSRACRQILINLLSNAIKFTKDGGAVRLGARAQGEDVVFSVSDDGIGMSPDFVSRLGEPFCQADEGRDRDHDGVGLGLSIVKGLTDLHGGSLEIASEPDVGTTVRIRIPRHVTLSRPVPHNETVRSIKRQERQPGANGDQPEEQKSISKGETRARLSA